MKTLTIAFSSLTLILVCSPGLSLADQPFNGKDLKGWSFKKKGKLESKWVTGTPQLDTGNPKALKASGTGGAMVNVVTGHGSDVGAALSSHPGIAKISFTWERPSATSELAC